jgi:predicted  nucleic acid-binding Zn-ribbon protein
VDDPEQLRLDLDDANARLDKLRKAIQVKEELEAEVSRLASELRNAKRRLKEAGWELGALINRERPGGRK